MDSYQDRLLQMTLSMVQGLFDREHLVESIAKQKQKQKSYWMYDPQREQDVFQRLHQSYPHLCLEQLFIVSVIIESQAAKASEQAYPLWSQKVHLETQSEGYSNSINPLLLKIYAPEYFAKLSLKAPFEYLKDL